MHIDVVPNRGARPTYLLRESFREGTRVRKRTIANLSALSDAQIEAIRAVLRGERLAPAAEQFEAIASRAHGHVAAVRVAMQRLEIANLVGTRPCRERDRVLAMVAARIVAPHTKLATTRWWHTTTLAEDCNVTDASEDDLYAAMDWLLARQPTIQKKARRAAFARRWSGALRPVVELFRRQLLSAGQARRQPRRQEGPVASQLRLAHRRQRLPSGRVGARG